MTEELEWTESARNRWEEFLTAKVWADGLDAEDGADLRENLTLHLDEELVEQNCEAVTLARVERAIAGLGGDPPAMSFLKRRKQIGKDSIGALRLGSWLPLEWPFPSSFLDSS